MVHNIIYAHKNSICCFSLLSIATAATTIIALYSIENIYDDSYVTILETIPDFVKQRGYF